MSVRCGECGESGESRERERKSVQVTKSGTSVCGAAVKRNNKIEIMGEAIVLSAGEESVESELKVVSRRELSECGVSVEREGVCVRERGAGRWSVA